MSNFQLLEVVGRYRDPQLQVAENLNKLTLLIGDHRGSSSFQAIVYWSVSSDNTML